MLMLDAIWNVLLMLESVEHKSVDLRRWTLKDVTKMVYILKYLSLEVWRRIDNKLLIFNDLFDILIAFCCQNLPN